MILYLNSLRGWSVASDRSTLERAPTVPVCADVWDRRHFKSGITLYYRPKDAALAVIIFHALFEVRRGEPQNRRNKASGAMVVF